MRRFSNGRVGPMDFLRRLAVPAVLGVVLDAAAAGVGPAEAQNAMNQNTTSQNTTSQITTGQRTAVLAARCAQLISYYDRYGVGRSLHTDGRRNTTRMDAEVECSRGQYARGIATMETLLKAKKFPVPPPGPSEIDYDE